MSSLPGLPGHSLSLQPLGKRVCALRQGHWGVIGLLGPAPSFDTLAKTGLLNHPHISEQDGGPGTDSPRPPSPLQPEPLSPLWHSQRSQLLFPSNLQEDWNNIYSAFCKYPLGERTLVHCSCATVTVHEPRCWSLFLNFSSCDSWKGSDVWGEAADSATRIHYSCSVLLFLFRVV